MKMNKSAFNIKLIALILLVTSFIGCKKEEEAILLETGTVTDIDNNIYKTIKIGNQWWMAEDLNTTRYRNGVVISTISGTDNAAWSNDTSGARVPNENISNGSGSLYNWFAIHNSNKLSPEGWHIPTDQDWKILENFLGMSVDQSDKTGWRGSNEGDKLKITGEDNWQTYGSVWATNEWGFSARATGCRLYDGSWSTPIGTVYMGFWWTDSEKDLNEGWYRYLDYKRSQIFRSHVLKTYGLSVRCVKD